ncbi:hypothetical protein ACROYT_G019423 [Oculina patagonica]
MAYPSDGDNRLNDFFFYELALSTAIAIAVLSPISVTGNALILAAIWKKTFVRTPFHIVLSGLAFTDLCTGLIAKPFFAAAIFMCLGTTRTVCETSKLIAIIRTIGAGSAIYFIATTILLITLMSIERWLHMSRRSLITSRRGCFTVVALLLYPIHAVVFRVLANESQRYGNYMTIAIIATTLTCYLITSFAYFKVYRIIRHHQQQVQASETSQNFGQQAINLAKYKKSVATMFYIMLLFSFCFLPYIVSSGLYISQSFSLEIYVIDRVSLVILFLSSTLNPGLYLWRMTDIRNGVKQLFCRGS